MTKLEQLINELCPNGVESKEIGEICNLSAGGDVPKSSFSNYKTEKYCVPIYSNGIGENALYGYTDKATVKAPCVTVSARGTIGYCELRKEDFYPVVRLICVSPNTSVLAEYIKDYMETLMNSDNYSSSPFYQEILADARATQTTWSRIIFDILGEIKSVFTDEEMQRIFPHILKAQDGIDLVRSFLLRSSNLRYLVNSVLLEDTNASIFIDFLIRDNFSKPVSLALLCGFDNNTGRGIYYLTLYEKYRCERNIPIIDRLFEDVFNNRFSILKQTIAKQK